MTRNVDAIRRLFGVAPEHDRTGNLPVLPGIFPDYLAPIVRNGEGGSELVMARRGVVRHLVQETDVREVSDPAPLLQRQVDAALAVGRVRPPASSIEAFLVRRLAHGTSEHRRAHQVEIDLAGGAVPRFSVSAM